MKKLIVFTDLDGTLLNHDDYQWQQAEPAIQLLRKHGFPLVLTSSKTRAEIRALNDELDNDAPFICENGALISTTLSCQDVTVEPGLRKSIALGKTYLEIIDILTQLRQQYQFKFSGFNDMSADRIAEVTGLSRPAAIEASLREASEPIQWQGFASDFIVFQRLLNEHGLQCLQGGRFYHVMSPVNKADAMSWLLKCYQQTQPQVDWQTVALGDGMNDLQMLVAANTGFLINNPHVKQPDIANYPHIRVIQQTGSTGWNQAIAGLLQSEYE